MKKHLAIAFLALFLMNVVGYYVWFAIEQAHTSYSFAQKISQNITINIDNTDEDIFIAKVKASVYGHVEDSDWEGTGGEFLHQGKYYEMVHQRILNDTLYIYCIANTQKSNLVQSFDSYIQTYLLDTFDSENPFSNTSTSKFFKSITKDFLVADTPHLVRVSWNVHTHFIITYNAADSCLPLHYYPVFTPPPEV